MDAEKILKSIVTNPKLVKKHASWGYYIDVPFEAIHMIGLIEKGKDYELSLFYGDSQQQSRNFYRLKPNFNRVNFKDWIIEPNFHLVSWHGRNLIWLESKLNNQQYLNFWSDNIRLLYRHEKADAIKLMNELEKKGVITLDYFQEAQLKEIFNKDFSAFNIAPGFKLVYKISKDKILALEKTNSLAKYLTDRINEGLSFIGEDGNNFLKIKHPRNFSNIKKSEGDPPDL